MRLKQLPRHVVFRLLALTDARLIDAPPGCPADYAITATATSCGVGVGDFCTHCDFPERGVPSCSLFGGKLALEGPIVADDHLDETRRVVGGREKLKALLAANPTGGAVLGLGPELMRSMLCLLADAGPLGRRRGFQMLTAQMHRAGSQNPFPTTPTHTAVESIEARANPAALPDGAHWDALRAFAVSQIAAQRVHACSLRALAAFLSLPAQDAPTIGSGPRVAGATPEQMATACREIADGTDAENARAEDALRRDDRAEIGRATGHAIEGYLRGLRHRGAL